MQTWLASLNITPPSRLAGPWRQAMLWHSLGFIVIVMLTWCEEFFGLMFWLFGRVHQPGGLDETIFKTAVIVLLWLLSAIALHRVISRLQYLENFLHLCSWCRQINHAGKWIKLEEHFKNQTGMQITHGICPTCASQFMSEMPKPVDNAPAPVGA